VDPRLQTEVNLNRHTDDYKTGPRRAERVGTLIAPMHFVEF